MLCLGQSVVYSCAAIFTGAAYRYIILGGTVIMIYVDMYICLYTHLYLKWDSCSPQHLAWHGAA